MTAPSPEPGDVRTGVIHDIGYRPYAGERQPPSRIALALFVAGLRNTFGLGRSAKSKILPFILLGLNLVPALIIVAVAVFIGLEDLPVSYAGYASTTQTLVSVFVAAQAPVLFSRDLRFGSIVLYLARPLGAGTYALMRWASLFAAMLVFLLTPVLILYLGAVLNDSDVSIQSSEAAWAALLAVLLAGMLAGVAGVLSAVSTRRGFAVVATIGVLLFGFGVVSAIQGVARSQDADRVGEVAGLFTPYNLYRGIVRAYLDTGQAITPPEGAAMQAAYLVVAFGVVLGGMGLLVLRYRRVAGR